MAEEIRSGGDPEPSRRIGMSSVVIRAEYASRSSPDSRASVERGSTRKEEFWANFRFATRRLDSTFGGDDEFLERRVRERFHIELKERVQKFLRQAYRPMRGVDLTTEFKRYNAIEELEFTTVDIWYGSINIETFIDHADQLIDAFGMTVDVLAAVLSACAPGALNAALGSDGLEWDITVPAINMPQASAPQQGPADQEPKGALARWRARFANPTFVWQLLNAFWVLPILVSLMVLLFTYREMNRITERHDSDRSKVLSDEITRVAARSDRFDEQHALLMQRQENVLKETTETIKTILADEIKRVAARADSFDQQQVLLLQRYENISKENSEIIKTLIQKSDACCKSCDCDCKKSKDHCQKSAESK